MKRNDGVWVFLGILSAAEVRKGGLRCSVARNSAELRPKTSAVNALLLCERHRIPLFFSRKIVRFSEMKQAVA
jgi:hypothetical protein